MSQSSLLDAITAQRGIITCEQFQQLALQLDADDNATAKWLLAHFKSWAFPPISKFYVSALVRAENEHGEDFFALGVNVELPHCALDTAVHAEQTAIHNAWLNGAVALKHIYINAAPCGYCRQFMNEFVVNQRLAVSINDTHTDLEQLLPLAFGPEDLNISQRVLTTSEQLSAQSNSNDQRSALMSHLAHSYAPYSGGRAAVQIDYEGKAYFGRYIENAAFNPSFNPFLAALSQIALTGKGIDFDKISAVTLAEEPSLKSHQSAVQSIVKVVAAHAQFDYLSSSSARAASIT
ncbi:cytidine deaminase [Pseudoalteromonas sp. SSDWG2]|uniref:cytidine deaminase n=1 Tax=Pseudoalteromonas sp. SSDWG2 TaxID=3139391 RepID=UPI003BAAEF8F